MVRKAYIRNKARKESYLRERVEKKYVEKEKGEELGKILVELFSDN